MYDVYVYVCMRRDNVIRLCIRMHTCANMYTRKSQDLVAFILLFTIIYFPRCF